jgi:hypothetical protein
MIADGVRYAAARKPVTRRGSKRRNLAYFFHENVTKPFTDCGSTKPTSNGLASTRLVFHRFPRSRSYGFHFTGVIVRGVPLLELIQPDAVSLHGLGSL